MFNQAAANLRIAGPKCYLVREKEIKPGDWFLQYTDNTFHDFDGGVRVLVKDMRMKAMDWIVTPPVISIIEDSPTYQAIKFRSDEYDDKKCLWGPEYCLEVDGVLALLYLGNKSSRYLISTIRVGGEYVLFSKKRVDGNYIWYVPVVVDAEAFDKVKQ